MTDSKRTTERMPTPERGFYGIGFAGSKYPSNFGTLVRSANAFGADFAFTLGCRYETDRAAVGHDGHIPVFSVDAVEDVTPHDATTVAIAYDEDSDREPVPLGDYDHPERAVYVLGAEDNGLGESLVETADEAVTIDTAYCLNVGIAGSIVLYDRVAGDGCADGVTFSEVFADD